MRLAVIEECPHCSKRLAGALDHWSKIFTELTINDEFAEEIAEVLTGKAAWLRRQAVIKEERAS